MSFLSRLFGGNRIRAETAQPPELIDLHDRRLLEMLGILGADEDFVSYRGKGALKEATVYACIRVLADSVGKLPLKVYQNQSAVDHYLTPLLKTRPNPWMNARDFFKALEVQRNVYGNAYAWPEFETRGPDAGKLIGIYPLDSTRVSLFIDDVGLLPGKGKLWYMYTDNMGTQYLIGPDEMLHFKGLTSDGIVGMTPLEQLKGTIENAGSASRFLNNSFKTGMQTKGVVYYAGDLNPEAEKRFLDNFERMSSGLKNANRISLLPIGYQFQPLSIKMTDAQFLENTELTIRQIAAAFGVKMHQINELSRATHMNVEHQQREFYVDTLMDILTGYEQEMTYKLFTQREIDAGYYVKFNVNAILRADPKTRYEGYRIAIQSGFMTPNEVRALEELEALPGGDRLLVNGNMMPIEMAGRQYQKDNSRGGERDAEKRKT